MFLPFLISLGFFVNYSVSVSMPSSRDQYRIVLAIPLIPCGIAFIGSFFLVDTPRWLASKDRGEEALATLSRLRGTDYTDPRVSYEYTELQEQVDETTNTCRCDFVDAGEGSHLDPYISQAVRLRSSCRLWPNGRLGMVSRIIFLRCVLLYFGL
jgi:hypothetical protein